MAAAAAAAADGGENDVGLKALNRLNSTEAPLYLTKSEELKEAARLASKYIFSSLSPYAPKSPFSQLLTGEEFDAEQIWQQIDLQAQPLLSSLRRHIRNFEKNPEEIGKQLNLDRASGDNKGNKGVESISEGLDVIDDSDDVDDDDDDDDDGEEEDEEDEEEEGEENENEDDEERENVNGVEDKFLKIKELEEYMKEDEAREYGLKKDNKNKRKRGKTAHEDDEDEDEDGSEDDGDEDGDEEDDEIDLMGLDDDADDENARYADFFGVRKVRPGRNTQYRRSDKLDRHEPDNNNNQAIHDEPANDINNDEDDDDDDDDDDDNGNVVINEPESNNDNQKKQSVSTHEKELERKRAEIEEMEKANLEPKTWTMQGEITAAKRPKNSALEVDLDFQHNVRPAPEMTVEATKSLEELIKKRILEGQFDDVPKPPTLSTKAPTEKKEMDENKSKKGLAELYEDEYAEKTGLVSAALTVSDEQKKEASALFKKLCVKLDALCHFHFAPKPVIEDMSIQTNVPALAMEEIAPLAVSDAAMLAPEEVYYGKGDIKEETELTQSDRKRRRAKKKRKFKAESAKTIVIKTQLTASTNPGKGNFVVHKTTGKEDK